MVIPHNVPWQTALVRGSLETSSCQKDEYGHNGAPAHKDCDILAPIPCTLLSSLDTVWEDHEH